MSTPSQPPQALKRKLIEVALPLEAINREAVRDGAKRRNHPWRLHYWWTRKPLAVARAVLFAQLVDDPSSDPDRFPSEDLQRAERARLHGLIERLVDWDNAADASLLAEARAEIVRSTGSPPPRILDPFAGGGAIPIEAQRLGLETVASDLNPVSVLINKALVEIPARFAGRPPVRPGVAVSRIDWGGATGLAADVRAYGALVRGQATEQLGSHYPRVQLADDLEAPPYAWIWVRTVPCPNPTCGFELPLTSKWWLGRRKGKEAWAVPSIIPDADRPSGRSLKFEIQQGASPGPDAALPLMDGRRGTSCLACGAAVSVDHVRSEALAGRMGSAMMATIADHKRRRVYVAPDAAQEAAAAAPRPTDSIDGTVSTNPRWFSPPMYGLTEFADLFTDRQLLTLTTFSDLVVAARRQVLVDAIAAGLGGGESLAQGGDQAEAYADAIATYLALALSRGSDYMASAASWHASNEQIRNVFALHAIPMPWDYLEANFLASGSGTWDSQVELAAQALEGLQPGAAATVRQQAAQTADFDETVVSTDPPYYDNVGYSDLSDFFYVWLRRSLREVYPDLFSTMLVPKADELVANPYRHHGREGARRFFEEGFRSVFVRARKAASATVPMTVYYAFKQSEDEGEGTASRGWETLLDGMVSGGWSITATWPLRTETTSRLLAQGTNTLASSIVLALRPRQVDAPTTDRRGLIQALQGELPEALRRLQQGTIAPVDLPQAAIGPGMAVFSRYAKVIETDGSTMTVRSALARINEILDQVLNEQEGHFDNATRFAIAWYRQHGYVKGGFGAADNMARARNTSVETMVHEGILTSAAGNVKLFAPDELAADYDVMNDDRIGVWEVLHHLLSRLERGGLPEAGEFLARVEGRPDAAVDIELVKELAFLLFSIAEKNGSTKDALSFNTVATAWPDIVDVAHSGAATTGAQTSFNLDEET